MFKKVSSWTLTSYNTQELKHILFPNTTEVAFEIVSLANKYITISFVTLLFTSYSYKFIFMHRAEEKTSPGSL